MKKTHFTRKNFIALALVYFYVVFMVIAAIGCDGGNNIMVAGNPIQKLGLLLGFPSINPGFAGLMLLCSLAVYIVIFATAFIYEMRLAKYYENVTWSKKWVLIYILTFILSFGLCFGIGMAAQYPYVTENIINSILFSVETMVVGLILYLICLSFIGAIIVLYVNFKHIDEPFRFFKKGANDESVELELREEEENEKLLEQGTLASSFGDNDFQNGGTSVNGVGSGVLSDGATINNAPVISEKERVFPGLCTIDMISENLKDIEETENINLKDLCDNFRMYLAKKEKLYFDISTIRAFISGLSASRLIILEGLSGTGKSSLARYFSEFISEKSFFEPVQATWRDRTSILGFFNDFTKTYNETEFLKRLYEFNYKKDHVNIMVLDEVNISRVEYYFADFLSILEYPIEEWKLKIMQLPYDFEAPEMLEDGILQIPQNTWFVGTANKDDSTFTITDKVYDRAITLSFDDRNEPFEVSEEVENIQISYDTLINLFKDAQENEEYKLTSEDITKLKTITDFTSDTFDIIFGNRIMKQIELLVPTFVACGGTKEEAIDFMFARKIIYKVEGRFEDYIAKGLADLKALITKTYGADAFNLTNKTIDKLLRKL